MRKANFNDKTVVISILAEAFDRNPSVNYVVKQDAYRRDRIRRLMEYAFDVCHAFGDVLISTDEQACALILLPDKKRTSLRAWWWDVKLALSVVGLSRVSAVLKRENQIKQFHPKYPICYLWFIGVRNASRGKGIGSALMGEVIRAYDGRPIYLETSVKENIPWYAKFCFETFHTIDLTYTLFMMKRN